MTRVTTVQEAPSITGDESSEQHWMNLLAKITQAHEFVDIDTLRDLATNLLRRNKHYHDRREELLDIQKQLKAKCEAMAAHEHHKVVITALDFTAGSNGDAPSVEVAGLGSGRVYVAVHPDVDTDQLRIGASGWVSQERNCLLGVNPNATPWRDIATFEQAIEGSERMLLRHREEVIAVDRADQLKGVSLQKGDLIGFDHNVSQLAFERLEPMNRSDLFDDSINASFDDLVGLEKPIALLRNVIDFRLRHPEVAAAYQLPERHGVLLYGPAGNAKTHLARCVASYVREMFADQPCRFMHISGAQDYSMWLGQSEQQIIERFRAAREAAKDGTVIMFFDEIDAIARRRGADAGSGAPDRILNTLLTQLDGIIQLKNIVIIAATNRSDTLDEGLTRPGRFDWKIEISGPQRRTALAILKLYLKNRPLADDAADIDRLVTPLVTAIFAPNGRYAEVAQVKLSDGRRLPVPGKDLLSGALLKNVINVAARNAALRETETGERGIRAGDLATALDSQLRSIVGLLTPLNVKSYAVSLPRDAQPIDVEVALNGSSTASFVRS